MSQSTKQIRRICYTIITLPLHALNSYRNFTNIQAPEFGYASPRLSEKQPNKDVNAKWRAKWNASVLKYDNVNSMQLYNRPSVCVNL